MSSSLRAGRRSKPKERMRVLEEKGAGSPPRRPDGGRSAESAWAPRSGASTSPLRKVASRLRPRRGRVSRPSPAQPGEVASFRTTWRR